MPPCQVTKKNLQVAATITKPNSTPSLIEIGEASTKLLISKLPGGSLADLVPVWGWGHSKR